MKNVLHRLICEIKLDGNIKIVTIRSCLTIHNNTMIPLEIMAVDETKKSKTVICLGKC